MTVAARREFVKQSKLCFNCLGTSHKVASCKSTFRCKRCRAAHHSLVHVDSNVASSQPLSNEPMPEEPVPVESIARPSVASNHSINTQEHLKPTLLPTILVHLRDKWEHSVQCRALLDSGHFVTEWFIQRIGAPRNNARGSIVASSCDAGVSRGRVNLTLCSRISADMLQVETLVLPKLTSSLPTHLIHFASAVLPFASLPLADPAFADPGPVDMLIGAYYLGEVYTGECNRSSSTLLVAMNTRFGWVILGPCDTHDKLLPRPAMVNHAMVDLDQLAQLFISTESIDAVPPTSSPEDPAEVHFRRTHFRDTDGSYVVYYPMRPNYPSITDTFGHSSIRLGQMKRRFRKHADLKLQYTKFLTEDQELGHMERIPHGQIDTPPATSFYLAHHAVLKPDSSTTKCRVVFDGSCKDSSGVSLNDRMMIGPPIQRDLFGVMLRFRRHQYVFTADVGKMFRGIKVAKEHQDLQRIIWREDDSAPIDHYLLLTVTYGLAASPFLAVRVLKQLALDNNSEFLGASQALIHDVYVDDILTGSNSVPGVIALKDNLITLLSKANFKLHKFSSNCSELMDTIPKELFDDATFKVLGVQWIPSCDVFGIKLGELKSRAPTKRIVLCEMSRIYDSLGIGAPVTILFKSLFQESWLHKLGWDQQLPDSLCERWTQYASQLHVLTNVKVPRYIGCTEGEVELHGFADASSIDCAAVVYSRFRVGDNYKSCLVAAKTRVAPMKALSIRPMELNAAVLLVRLLARVRASLNNTVVTFRCWTDSEIVLHWMSSEPRRWQTFVCNRVTEILEVAPRLAACPF